MKWLSSLSGAKRSPGSNESAPTSSSLIALFLVFVVSWMYLAWQKPDYVMDGEKLSYRRVFVYSLLSSTSVALVVFGYVYWKNRKVKKGPSNHSEHSKSREKETKSREKESQSEKSSKSKSV